MIVLCFGIDWKKAQKKGKVWWNKKGLFTNSNKKKWCLKGWKSFINSNWDLNCFKLNKGNFLLRQLSLLICLSCVRKGGWKTLSMIFLFLLLNSLADAEQMDDWNLGNSFNGWNKIRWCKNKFRLDDINLSFSISNFCEEGWTKLEEWEGFNF